MAETIIQKDRTRPSPLIDSDPHFFRVVRYMRPSDYAVWGAAAVSAPGALFLWSTPPSHALYKMSEADCGLV